MIPKTEKKKIGQFLPITITIYTEKKIVNGENTGIWNVRIDSHQLELN